jgi:hypothetical protein
MPLRDDSWLSLTPEPERLLPEARAVLRSGQAPPPPALLAAERDAAERLVLRGRRARWEAWLRDSAALAELHDAAIAQRANGTAEPHPTAVPDATTAPGPTTLPDATAATVALVRDVVANHDALVLGLPGERRNRRR